MELKDFIQEALVQVVKGIEGANQELAAPSEKPLRGLASRHFAWRPRTGDDPGTVVDFDIAVSTKSKKELGGGIQVLSLHLGGAAKGERENVSRVRFTVEFAQHAS